MRELLCVGSGMAPRYRANTLQALALPKGARIQFRYSQGIIPEALRNALSGNSLVGAAVLLGHVDATPLPRDADGPCFVVPYRAATLIAARRVGSFFTLQLELGPRRIAKDIDAFQELLPNTSPHWSKTASPKRPVGYWCQEATNIIAATQKAAGVEGWQALVNQLKDQPDFKKQSYFYVIDGLYEIKASKNTGEADGYAAQELVNGQFTLRARQTYELRVVHFDPQADDHWADKKPRVLKIEAPTALVVPRTSSELVVDSPYDAKTYTFSIADTPADQYASLLLKPQPPEKSSNEEDDIPELYFPLFLKADLVSNLGRAFLLGSLLGLGQMVPMFLKGTTDAVTTVVTFTFSYLTGIFFIAGLKKPL